MTLESDQSVALIEWIGKLAELREDPTGNHSKNIRKYMNALIEEAKDDRHYKAEISRWDIPAVLSAAVLHDLGKIKIPDSILLKKGRLTIQEFDEMKKHCQHGKMLLELLQQDTQIKFMEHAKLITYYHHEKWDGTGYPEGIKGEKIPLEARMLALVDVYDVLVSKRSYKPPYPHNSALELIMEEKGTHFDPVLVDLFMKVFSKLEQ